MKAKKVKVRLVGNDNTSLEEQREILHTFFEFMSKISSKKKLSAQVGKNLLVKSKD